MTVYAGSDGSLYTDWEVGRKYESGAWRCHLWDEEAGWYLVDTDDGVVWLVEREECDLPSWAEVRTDGAGPTVVDRRRGAD